MNDLDRFERIVDTLKENFEISCFEVIRGFDGKSGDYVCLVEVIMNNPVYNGYAVLKLSKNHKVWKNEEYELHNNAVEFNEGFSKKYIPDLIGKVESDEETAFLMKIAGGGVNATDVLYDVSSKIQGETCCLIGSSILDGWHVQGQNMNVFCTEIQADFGQSTRLFHQIPPVFSSKIDNRLRIYRSFSYRADFSHKSVQNSLISDNKSYLKRFSGWLICDHVFALVACKG